MTSSSKRKGDRAELEIARLLGDELGFTIRRKLGAGRADDTGDLDGLPDCVAQVKDYGDVLRAVREAMTDLPKQRANAGATHSVAFVRRRGGNWIAVMDVPSWCALFREGLS